MSDTTTPLDTAQPITLDAVTAGRYRVQTEHSDYVIDFDRMVFTRTAREPGADVDIRPATLFELADGDTPFESAFVVLYQRMVIRLVREPKQLVSTSVLHIEREA